ncbi:hypothetical protein ABPG74_021375 [Tetrahymena malaccensis]
MFIFKKFTNKNSRPTNLQDQNDSQSSEENINKQFSQKIQLPLKKALFPNFYQSQPSIQSIYQNGVKIFKNLQDIIEQIPTNKLLCSQENIKKTWKEVDQVFQKLEGTQICNQIKLIFYQFIYKTLNLEEQTIDYISDELNCYDKERYSLIQFFIQWQQQYSKNYAEECYLSKNRGLNLLKYFIDKIQSSFEICCFLNFYQQDILTPLKFQLENMQQPNQKLMIENQIQEQTIISILETVLFIYNFQLYLPSQLVQQYFSNNMYQDKSKNNQQENLKKQQLSNIIIHNKPIQLSKTNDDYDKKTILQPNFQLSNDTNSDNVNFNQKLSYEWNKQQSSTENEQIYKTYENIQLNQSFDNSVLVQPLSYVLWHEYEIIKRFTNYINFVQFFIGEVVNFNSQDECTSNISVKSSASSSDEVESNHKKIIFQNKLIQELIIHFQQSDQQKILNNQNFIKNEFISSYHPLLDFQNCVIKNGKTKTVHINSKSKISINVDIFEKLSIVNLSIGILNKDIKLCIKYLGSLDGIEKFNPVELIRTNKINQTPYRINFLAEQEGIYCIEFINSYSWFASKEIEYRINILTPFQVGLNQSISFTKTIFPVASKPFHQQAVEQFQENQKIFNQASDQALLVINQNMLTILYKANNNQNNSNILEIFKSKENSNIFETLEPQAVSSLLSVIDQFYKQDSKIYFNSSSKNKLVLYIIVENEEQKQYFQKDSLFWLIVSHNFPASEIIIELFPNIFIQMFLMQVYFQLLNYYLIFLLKEKGNHLQVKNYTLLVIQQQSLQIQQL